MPRSRTKTRQAATVTDVLIPTTAETIVATLAGISTVAADERLMLQGWLVMGTGTATTTVTVRVRRGAAVTDPVVGEAGAEAAAAGVEIHLSILVQDIPGEVAGQTYILTVQQTAATGNGSMREASLAATAPA